MDRLKEESIVFLAESFSLSRALDVDDSVRAPPPGQYLPGATFVFEIRDQTVAHRHNKSNVRARRPIPRPVVFSFKCIAIKLGADARSQKSSIYLH